MPAGYQSDSDTAARRPLLERLAGLDALLNRALERAAVAYAWEPGATQFRGLYVTEKDIRCLLDRSAGSPAFSDLPDHRSELIDGFPALSGIAARHGLTDFESAVLMVALAPEVDLRYERIYAYLQDDIARRRPAVDLILNLLCDTSGEKLELRSRFAADAPLRKRRLIRLWPEPNQACPPLLAQPVMLDPQVIRELLGGTELDSRLAPFSERLQATVSLSSLPLPDSHVEGLRRLVYTSRASGRTLMLWFRGPAAPLKRRAAEALASEAGRPLLAVSATLAARSAAEPGEYLPLAVREALLNGAMLFLDAGEAADETVLGALGAALHEEPVDCILAAGSVAASAGQPALVEVPFSIAPYALRRECWLASLDGDGIRHSDYDRLAARFRLSPDQVESAASAARNLAAWRGSRTPAASDLYAAARSLCGRQLGALALKVNPIHGWDDIVLPPATLRQLRAICTRVTHGQKVLGEWGFDARLSMGKGVTALFAGPSGVGKTMAAEIIARELELDLYKIDLSSVVSKYIGETEKNLERIFNAAENASAILFFDEADSLFGKRSEVRDSHDRYANLEISYLLQRMEMYEGVAILASNLRQNLDESFVRRLAFTVHFPFPDEADRRRIWAAIWPPCAPLDPTIDFDFLAAQFKLSGGNIRNIALAAAFAAAGENSVIRMRHVVAAIEREYQKMSKPLPKEQFGPYAAEVER